MTDDNIGTNFSDRGMITLSWSSSQEVTLDESEVLFELIFAKKGSGDYKLSISSDITSTEAYFNDDVTDKIELSFKTIAGLAVSQNEPNPWKDRTNINFTISDNGYVGFNVMDLSGKLILSKSNYFNAGSNQINLERSELPNAGLYFYEIYSQGQKVTKKMIILD